MKQKTKKLIKWAVFGSLLFTPIIMAIIDKRKKKIEMNKVPFTGSDQTRGIRNNNPLNIRKTGIDWKHKIEGEDPDFETFDAMLWGVRAALRNMRTHYMRGVNTINKLITVWAPPTENDTDNYVNYVAGQTGTEKHSGFNWNPDWVYPIIKAMCMIESKYNLKRELFDEAWDEI